MKVAHYQQVQPQIDHGLGGVVMRGPIREEDGAPHFGMHVFELEQGAGTVFHRHWWEHEIFVLSGKGFIIAGGKKASLYEGLVVLVPGDEPHQLVNTGEGVLRFLCVSPHPWLKGVARKRILTKRSRYERNNSALAFG